MQDYYPVWKDSLPSDIECTNKTENFNNYFNSFNAHYTAFMELFTDAKDVILDKQLKLSYIQLKKRYLQLKDCFVSMISSCDGETWIPSALIDKFLYLLQQLLSCYNNLKEIGNKLQFPELAELQHQSSINTVSILTIAADNRSCFPQLLKLFVTIPLIGASAPAYSHRLLTELFRYTQSLNTQSLIVPIETHFSLYRLGYEYATILADLALEIEFIFALATCYTQQWQPRFAAFYSAYALHLSQVANLANLSNNMIQHLAYQEIYLRYTLLAAPNSYFIDQQLRYHGVNKDKPDIVHKLYDQLCELGDVFWAKGDINLAKQCYIKLDSLLRSYPQFNTNTTNNYLARCREHLGALMAPIPPSLEKSALDPLPNLKQMREELTLKRNQYTKRLLSEDATSLPSEWSHFLIKFITKIVQKVIAQLGSPPCEQFAILRLGSLARDVACWYSDFEWAIVWEDTDLLINKENVTAYFEAFTKLVEIHFIALGQTNELFMHDGVNNSKFDRMARGLRFDEAGHYPFSGKFSLFFRLRNLQHDIAPRHDFQEVQ